MSNCVVSNNELTQIFNHGLGSQDRYSLISVRNGTFVNKYKDDATKLIRTMVENIYQNVTKLIGE